MLIELFKLLLYSSLQGAVLSISTVISIMDYC